jgi:hypothetical protein
MIFTISEILLVTYEQTAEGFKSSVLAVVLIIVFVMVLTALIFKLFSK